MSLINTINEGDVVQGSIPITLTYANPAYGTTQGFETDNFKLDQQTASFRRLSSKGIKTGSVNILQANYGTATLKYSASTVYPADFGASFTASPNPVNATPITYACTITKVGKPYTMAGEAKMDIEFEVTTSAVVLSTQT